MTLVTAGRVGKSHGLDGSFYVDTARHPLPEGTPVVLTQEQVTKASDYLTANWSIELP